MAGRNGDGLAFSPEIPSFEKMESLQILYQIKTPPF
jgi:hypothetical protein